MAGRDSSRAREYLAADARYLNPMKTVAVSRPRLLQSEPEYSKIIAAVMGYGSA